MELKQCVIFIILMYICGVSYAEDSDAQLLAKGMWRDTSTGLIWMRCSLGQTWTGETCTGKAKKYTWPIAMLAANKSNFAGKNDWQLPSIEDLANIRKCTTGEKEKTYSWKFPGNNGEDIPYSYIPIQPEGTGIVIV